MSSVKDYPSNAAARVLVTERGENAVRKPLHVLAHDGVARYSRALILVELLFKTRVNCLNSAVLT